MKAARQHVETGELAPWTMYHLVFALQNAAEFLENEKLPVVGQGIQAAANMEAARRIRAHTERLVKEHFGGWDTRRPHAMQPSLAATLPRAALPAA